MNLVQASAVLALVLSVFVGAGMAIGTTSYATAPVSDGYGVAAD